MLAAATTCSWIDFVLAMPVVEDCSVTLAGAAAFAGAVTLAGGEAFAAIAWVATALPVVCWLASEAGGVTRVPGPALASSGGLGCGSGRTVVRRG
jgi:hypothetical protein